MPHAQNALQIISKNFRGIDISLPTFHNLGDLTPVPSEIDAPRLEVPLDSSMSPTQDCRSGF